MWTKHQRERAGPSSHVASVSGVRRQRRLLGGQRPGRRRRSAAEVRDRHFFGLRSGLELLLGDLEALLHICAQVGEDGEIRTRDVQACWKDLCLAIKPWAWIAIPKSALHKRVYFALNWQPITYIFLLLVLHINVSFNEYFLCFMFRKLKKYATNKNERISLFGICLWSWGAWV